VIQDHFSVSSLISWCLNARLPTRRSLKCRPSLCLCLSLPSFPAFKTGHFHFSTWLMRIQKILRGPLLDIEFRALCFLDNYSTTWTTSVILLIWACFHIGSSTFSHGSLEPRSSYLPFMNSWDYRHTLPCVACF
jgi:hypothetical protein